MYHFSDKILIYGIILLIILFILFFILKQQAYELKGDGEEYKYEDGNGPAYRKGRGSEEDEVETLIDRIKWASYISKRVSHWQRAFIPALLITLLIVLVVYRTLPPPENVVLILLISWLVILLCQSYFYTHGDIYNDYYLYHNAELIQAKMGYEGCSRDGVPDALPGDLPDRPEMMLH